MIVDPPPVASIPDWAKKYFNRTVVNVPTTRQISRKHWLLTEYEIWHHRGEDKEFVGRKLVLTYGVPLCPMAEIGGDQIDRVFAEFKKGKWPVELRSDAVARVLSDYPDSDYARSPRHWVKKWREG